MPPYFQESTKNEQTKTTAVNRYRGITYNVCVQNVICIETN